MGIVQKQLNAKVGENVNLDIEEILALIDSEGNGRSNDDWYERC